MPARSSGLPGGVLATVLALAANAQHTLTGELPAPASSPSRPEVVAVAGATGRTGRLIVSQLAATRRYAVRALARDPAGAPRDAGAAVQWVRADVTQPRTLGPALEGATYLLVAVGATDRSGPNGPEAVDYAGVRNLSDAARSAGVRQVVLISSIGAGGEGGVTRWILNLIGGDILKCKARGEAALRASGVPYTIVRAGGLRDSPGGQTGLRLSQGDRDFGEISRADVASVVIAAMGNADAVGKTFEVVADKKRPPAGWRTEIAALKPDAAGR